MYGGQGVGLVNDIIPAGDVIKNFVEGAEKIIKDLNGKLADPAATPPVDEVQAISLDK